MAKLKFQALPKFTIACYLISLVIIGFIFAKHYFAWQFLNQQATITILVIAAIIGVAGSIVSIGKQLAHYLTKKQ
ncbi:MAG: hypothetical protein HWD86_07235 [Kangiellaceae bacterium]|nr:hypothetical protein [Kangiellaceae bacterium]